MPLAEAVIILRRVVRKRFGQVVSVRLEESGTPGADLQPGSSPLITIDGKLFSQGTFSIKAIIAELERLGV